MLTYKGFLVLSKPFNRLTLDLLLLVLVRATPVPDNDLDYASKLGQLMHVKTEWKELISMRLFGAAS